MTDYNGVLICGEVIEGKITTITREILRKGRELSDDLNQPLSLLLIGENIQEAAEEAILLGGEIIYLVNGAPFTESPPELYLAIITHICNRIKPYIILFGHTDMGRDIAPRLAAKLDMNACLDCVELAIDPETKSLLATKPVYGGNAKAVWASQGKQPQVISIRARSSEPAEPDTSRKGKIIKAAVEINDSMIKAKLLETVEEEVKGKKLEEAEVVVAGGGGIGGSQGFQLIEELARILGGAVGITRVPRDEGWMPTSLEIGQTGHIVSPNLYIAVGISGAPQHLAGCSLSRCIVAINKDPEAHIFKEADFGIVGDYREALPHLIQKLKEVLAI